MKSKRTLLAWDATFVTAVVLYLVCDVRPHYQLVIGLTAVNLLINCVKNHITAFKLNGKVY